nr:alpha/beta hydrolase fold protein [Tanacetum cinerariifolium]
MELKTSVNSLRFRSYGRNNDQPDFNSKIVFFRKLFLKVSRLFAAVDSKLPHRFPVAEYLRLIQCPSLGEFESVHRDLNIGFGKWNFDPLDLNNPFPNDEGSVHIWMGDEDLIVPATLQ